MITFKDTIYAQRLRSLRRTKDIKQEEAARLLGLESQQAYSNLEGGKVHFTEAILNKICAVFNIKPAEFEKTDTEFPLVKGNKLPLNNNLPAGGG